MDVQLTRDGAIVHFSRDRSAGSVLDVRRRHMVGFIRSVVLQPVSAVTAAAQEPLADEWRAATTASDSA